MVPFVFRMNFLVFGAIEVEATKSWTRVTVSKKSRIEPQTALWKIKLSYQWHSAEKTNVITTQHKQSDIWNLMNFKLNKKWTTSLLADNCIRWFFQVPPKSPIWRMNGTDKMPTITPRLRCWLHGCENLSWISTHFIIRCGNLLKSYASKST